jgi:hypothetical protein
MGYLTEHEKEKNWGLVPMNLGSIKQWLEDDVHTTNRQGYALEKWV